VEALERFLAGLRPAAREEARRDPNLAGVLDARLAEARSAHRDIELSPSVLAAYLAQRVAEGEHPVESLRTMRVADLFLACACSEKHPAALARFDALCEEIILETQPRFHRLAIGKDEVHQRLRERLLVGGAGHRPKILEYAGTGDLSSWLRVAAGRLFLNVATRESKEAPFEQPFFDALVENAPSAEAAYIRAEGHAYLKDVVRAAAARLSPRDKCLLRLAYGDGRSVRQIGDVYGVHGATAARWIDGARRALFTLIKGELSERLPNKRGEAASVLRAALSHVNFSLSTIFRSD
jgi:RNA polymerase sigma-70 factor (ECF subfamily)